MPERPWQDKDVIAEMRGRKAMDISEIADELGTSRQTIHKWVDRFDIEPYYRDPETLKRLHYEEEMTYPEMAEHLHCSRDTIAREMKKHDLGRGRGSMTKRTNYAHYYICSEGYEKWVDTVTRGCVPVHRLLAVSEFGVEAVKDMHVHHINHHKLDNRPENISLMEPGEHRAYHNNHRRDPEQTALERYKKLVELKNERIAELEAQLEAE
jgi:DNA-binding XRE family transcriptional regulator